MKPGLAQTSGTDSLSCPDCDTFSDYTVHLSRCERCGLARTRRGTTPTDGQNYLDTGPDQRRVRRQYFEMLASRYLSQTAGRALDVGCATGEWVELLSRRGWVAKGIDAYDGFTGDGKRFFRGHIETFETAERFDLITLVHCLEHIAAPVQALHKVRSLLVPQGQVLIVVPNVAGEWSLLLGERWHMLDLHHHIYHYTIDALRRVVERAGLRVVAVRTYSGHAASPVEIRLSEGGYYERGPGAYWPLRPLIFRSVAALRPLWCWWIDRQLRGDEIQLLASSAEPAPSFA